MKKPILVSLFLFNHPLKALMCNVSGLVKDKSDALTYSSSVDGRVCAYNLDSLKLVASLSLCSSLIRQQQQLVVVGNTCYKWAVQTRVSSLTLRCRWQPTLCILCLCHIVSCQRDWWLGSRVVSVLDSGAEGPGSNRSRDAVG